MERSMLMFPCASKLLRWPMKAIDYIFIQLTLLPLFAEVTTKSAFQSESLEHLSEILSARSKVVMNGKLEIVAITYSASVKVPSGIIAPLIILLWSFMNRTYYEGLPLEHSVDHEWRERIKYSTPKLVASVYAVPELYQVFFIISQVITHGSWVASLLVGLVFGIHAGIRGYRSPWYLKSQ
ncbi:hypothetical protein DL96DRAFT_1724330 [Flagelloscypha sp. PMI_526]|nr:hypothetical protein DL96DRAFT_1724330 [Flagelloscypha sp. PMI_526]